MDTDIDIDLTIFKDLNPDEPNDGRASQRIGVLLQYEQRMRSAGKSASKVRSILAEFCDAVYPAQLAADDYIAVVEEIGDDAKRRQFVSRLGLNCARVADCALTRRHFRGRRSDSAEEEQTHVRHAIVDRLATLHFNLLHLTQLGLRGHDDDEAESEEVQKAVMGLDSAKFTLSVSTEEGRDKGRFSLSMFLRF